MDGAGRRELGCRSRLRVPGRAWPAICFACITGRLASSREAGTKAQVTTLLSTLSCVRLLATLCTAAYQAPPSMGFSRQKYWSGVPLSLSRVQLFCDAMNCSPPGSSVYGDSPSKNTGVGCHPLLQGIFPTQESNLGLLHSRQIFYHLSHQGSP